VLNVSASNVTITSYPGEQAKLQGIIHVRNGANGVRLSKLTVEGTGEMNTIKVYAADFVLEDSDVTNAWRGKSCMMLGGSGSSETALRPIIRRNRFHECGLLGSKFDHSIYAANVVEGRISDNIFWNVSGYTLILYPNAQRTVFSHNVVDGDAPSVRGGVAFGGDATNVSRDNVIEYNVVVNARTFNITSSWDAVVGTGNIARSNCVWGGVQGNVSGAGFTSQNNVTADPLLLDRAGHNYRLRPGSACLALVGHDTAARLG
jgi:hypothetical protein